MPGAAPPQQLDQILEVLDVAALVGADGDALDILLERGVHHLAHGAVVPEVDHLRTLGLKDAPHDVDRGVMPVEEAGSGDKADGMLSARHVLHS